MHAKNQLHLSFPFLDIAKVLQTCYFGYFGLAWLWLVKAMLPACRKCWCLSSCKKPYLPLISFLKYYKNIVNLLFWVLWTCYFGYCWKLWCLSANKSSTWTLIFFTDIITLITNFAIKNVLGRNSRARVLPDLGLRLKDKNQKNFHLQLFWKNKWQNL